MSQCQISNYENGEADRCENKSYKKYNGIWLCVEHYKAFKKAVQGSLKKELFGDDE